MANKTLQLLRNASLYASHEAALNALKTQLETANDGSPVLARYNTTVEEDGVQKTVERTLLGIAGKTAGQYEIFDNQGGNDAIKAAIEALDVNAITAGDGEFIKSVSETDGKISATAAEMPTVAAISEAGKPIVSVSQTKGTVGATAGTIDAQYVDVADDGGKLVATNVEAALAELADKITANAVASDDGSIIINTTGGDTDLSVNIDGTTIVKNSGALKANLTLAKLTADEVTALADANVKEAYKIIYATDSNRTAIGDTVKIYKDSALYRVYLGHVNDTITSATDPTVVDGTGDTALCFIYQKADGTYELVAVNVESFLQESEFADGLQVNNHVVSVKVDSTSESFLTVGANGVKLSGVQDAIDDAVEGLDATLSQNAGADGLALSLTEVNGVVTAISGSIAANTYDAHGAAATAKSEVIGESTDAASADTINGAKKYADEAVAAAVEDLDVTDAAVANQFVTSVSETNGVISVTRAQPAAAGVTVADSAGYFSATDVEGALVELAAFDCGTY